MKITAISDLHGFYPALPGGDLLIVAGDLTASDTECQYFKLLQKLKYENYEKIIIIYGNHDNCLEKDDFTINWAIDSDEIFEYLCDSGCEFEGLKIWGSPWTSKFPGINPRCCAFTCDTDEQLAEKWALIPDDIDILVTHSPMEGCFDYVERKAENTGSISLRDRIREIKPLLHIHGHIHEAGGSKVTLNYGGRDTIHVNASHVNEYYKPVNKPINIEL